MATNVHYESNFADRQPCRECGKNNVYTRIFVDKNETKSRWLCYSCADDYIFKWSWHLLQLDVKIHEEELPQK